MKFVYNAEKEAKSREILMMQPTVKEAEELLEKDETDPYTWYVMTALSLENRIDEAIDAHCTGLSYAPFYILNYFGPSKKTQRKRRMEAGTGRLYSLHSAGTTELDIIDTTGLLQRISMAWRKKVSETSRNA